MARILTGYPKGEQDAAELWEILRQTIFAPNIFEIVACGPPPPPAKKNYEEVPNQLQL